MARAKTPRARSQHVVAGHDLLIGEVAAVTSLSSSRRTGGRSTDTRRSCRSRLGLPSRPERYFRLASAPLVGPGREVDLRVADPGNDRVHQDIVGGQVDDQVTGQYVYPLLGGGVRRAMELARPPTRSSSATVLLPALSPPRPTARSSKSGAEASQKAWFSTSSGRSPSRSSCGT